MIKGLSEQIEGLKKVNSYLFEVYEDGKPVSQNTPTSVPNTTADNDLRKQFGLDIYVTLVLSIFSNLK